MYLEDRTVRLQLWDTAGQVRKEAKGLVCKAPTPLAPNLCQMLTCSDDIVVS